MKYQITIQGNTESPVVDWKINSNANNLQSSGVSKDLLSALQAICLLYAATVSPEEKKEAKA
jgi:hypothetical protein